MQTTDLIRRVATQTGIIPDDVKSILEATFSSIREEVEKGGKIVIPNFGIFTHKVRPPKRAYHLGGYGRKDKAPKMIILPETKLPHFRPTKTFTIE